MTIIPLRKGPTLATILFAAIIILCWTKWSQSQSVLSIACPRHHIAQSQINVKLWRVQVVAAVKLDVTTEKNQATAESNTYRKQEKMR